MTRTPTKMMTRAEVGREGYRDDTGMGGGSCIDEDEPKKLKIDSALAFSGIFPLVFAERLWSYELLRDLNARGLYEGLMSSMGRREMGQASPLAILLASSGRISLCKL